MTDKVQINPMITAETRAWLRRTSQERGLAQGDLVEQALLAYLLASEDAEPCGKVSSEQDQFRTQQEQMRTTQLAMQATLEDLSTAVHGLADLSTALTTLGELLYAFLEGQKTSEPARS